MATVWFKYYIWCEREFKILVHRKRGMTVW